ncbi:MAG: methyltransferase domain-containing protein [Gammaproteobacteria bacterium]|nr:MAG: methyltransferase domain-containing protein [Gammaproteobacteria bacterium]
MAKQPDNQDRNFDELALRFQKNIYGGLKGEIRLAVLERDFQEHFNFAPFGNETSKPLRILDAGGGQGQFALKFAQAGHSVVICDISIEMLKLAEQEFVKHGLQKNLRLIHCAIQDLSKHLDSQECLFDVVLCHAVMEWVMQPHDLLVNLPAYVKPQGLLSLTFYNIHSLIYKNLLRTNFKKIQAGDFGGSRGSLTPINPLYPEQVFNWFGELPLDVLATSGIRVFHDYIFNEEHRERDPKSVVELELSFSRKMPYQLLGRYIHVISKRV